MKIELPVEQWNAVDEAIKRNVELLTLARANIAQQATAQAAAEAPAPEPVTPAKRKPRGSKR